MGPLIMIRKVILSLELVYLTPVVMFFGAIYLMSAVVLVGWGIARVLGFQPEGANTPWESGWGLVPGFMALSGVTFLGMLSLLILFALVWIHLLNLRLSVKILKLALLGLIPGYLFVGISIYEVYFKGVDDLGSAVIGPGVVFYPVILLIAFHLSALTLIQIRRSSI